jgi:hypothetical protein
MQIYFVCFYFLKFPMWHVGVCKQMPFFPDGLKKTGSENIKLLPACIV